MLKPLESILETKMSVKKRLNILFSVLTENNMFSAVREHSESCGAAVDIDSFRVLSTSSYELDLRILESLFIFKTKPDLNNQLSSYPLSIVKP